MYPSVFCYFCVSRPSITHSGLEFPVKPIQLSAVSFSFLPLAVDQVPLLPLLLFRLWGQAEHDNSFRSPSDSRNWLCSCRAEGASDALWSLHVRMLLPCGTPKLSCIYWKVTTDTQLPQTIQQVLGLFVYPHVQKSSPNFCVLVSKPVLPAGASPANLLYFSVAHCGVVPTSCNSRCH